MSIFGETLRQARAHKGVTVKEAEQATRISRLYLSALEDEHFEALPPLIYQRGIVRNYATYLDLDPNKLLAMFEEARGGVAEADVSPSTPPLNMPSHWAPNFAIIAFVLVLGMIVFAWFYSAFLAPGHPAPTATAPVETVTPMPTEEEARRNVVSLVATATKAPKPTRTPVPEVPTPTVEPTPTPVAEVDGADVDPVEDEPAQNIAPEEPVEETVVEEDVVEEPTVEEESEPEVVEEDEEPSGPTVEVIFQPSTDIYLTVVNADEVTLYDDFLAAGSIAGPYSSEHFYVYTSDADDTWITNTAVGVPFVMGGDGEMTFPLAPL